MVTAFVPIKLQSQRVPGKNLRLLGNKPLFLWVLETLKKCSGVDRIIVYCSDEGIKSMLPDQIELLLRPDYLDQDVTKGADIYDSFISCVDSEYYLLVHTTSPFIKSKTIDNAISKVKFGDYDSSFPVKSIQNFCWYNEQPINYRVDDIPRTQDLTPVFEETSGYFLFSKSLWLDKKRRIGYKPYISKLNEIEAVDIDTEVQFAFAETLLQKGLIE